MEPVFFSSFANHWRCVAVNFDPLATLHSCMENPPLADVSNFFWKEMFGTTFWCFNDDRKLHKLHKLHGLKQFLSEKKKRICHPHCYAGGIPGGISAPLSLGGTDWLWKKCSKCPARFERGTCAFGCPTLPPDGLRQFGRWDSFDSIRCFQK